jgi:hypothetical protein
MTDAQRILQLFRTSQGRRISCAELVEGNYFGSKKIIEYSGRITDARKIIGCSCGKDPNACTASEHILNIKRNWYQYRGSLDVVEVRKEQIMVSVEELEQKRNELATAYREARANGDATRMKILEARGKMIRNSLDLQRKLNEVKTALF